MEITDASDLGESPLLPSSGEKWIQHTQELAKFGQIIRHPDLWVEPLGGDTASHDIRRRRRRKGAEEEKDEDEEEEEDRNIHIILLSLFLLTKPKWYVFYYRTGGNDIVMCLRGHSCCCLNELMKFTTLSAERYGADCINIIKSKIL